MKDLIEYIKNVQDELDDAARSYGEIVGGEVVIGDIYKMEGVPFDNNETVLEVLTVE